MKKQQKPAESQEAKFPVVIFCDDFSNFETIFGRPKALIPFGPWALIDLTLESISFNDFIGDVFLLVSKNFEAVEQHVK